MLACWSRLASWVGTFTVSSLFYFKRKCILYSTISSLRVLPQQTASQGARRCSDPVQESLRGGGGGQSIPLQGEPSRKDHIWCPRWSCIQEVSAQWSIFPKTNFIYVYPISASLNFIRICWLGMLTPPPPCWCASSITMSWMWPWLKNPLLNRCRSSTIFWELWWTPGWWS